MSNKVSGGATLWARQTIESEIFYYKPAIWFKIWFYIVNKVNHKDTNLFPRGSNLITYKEIMDNTKATYGQTDKCIRFLKKAQMATTRRTTRGTIITILNYSKYQTLENYQSRQQSSSGRDAVDTINKNEKNEYKKIYVFFKKNFWDLYPAEFRVNKKSAFEVFEKINDIEKTSVKFPYSLKKQIDYRNWQIKNTGWAPDFQTPENWLKNERWLDITPEVPKNGNGSRLDKDPYFCEICKKKRSAISRPGLCIDCALDNQEYKKNNIKTSAVKEVLS